MVFLVSALVVYLLTSLWETVFHWKVLHASRKTRQFWKRKGGVFHLMRKAHFSHSVIHHRATFKGDFYTQFTNAEDEEKLKKRLFAMLPEGFANGIVRNRYGLRISSFWEVFCFITVPLLFVFLLYLVFGASSILWCAFIAVIPTFLSIVVHPLIHSRLFEGSRLLSYIRNYHKTHHKYGLCNFNLMIYGDFVLDAVKKY